MGILLAMPFGPINLLGIQRAVERGFFGGMAAGIGIMAGDGLIALGAALGVNAISGAIRQYRTVIQIIGGVALLGFGIRLYLARRGGRHRGACREGLAVGLHLGHPADVFPHHHQPRRRDLR
jgi:threonine/homoserine/homoserine lactone efflux protein